MNTEECVVIADKFPKARHHLLLIPKDAEFRHATPSTLTQAHLPKLRKLHKAALAFVGKYCTTVPGVSPADFRVGYHSLPSMKPLHIHMISQDFVSDALKTKKHFLSFTTLFFLPVKEVEETLEFSDGLSIEESAMEDQLKGPLQCHKCSRVHANMPALKAHLQSCDPAAGRGRAALTLS